MYILYSLLLAVALVVSLPWWLLRLGKYHAGFRERLGLVPDRLRSAARRGGVWIHAVSVGEVLAVSHLVSELGKNSPEQAVFVSTTTATGQRLARERFGSSRVFYVPLDLGPAVRAYLNVLRPRLLILAETEFWPNLLRLAHKGGAAVAIVNARISDRSFPRYRRFRWFFSRVLSEVDLFLAQTDVDAQRLRDIGATTERVRVSGNLKFDVRGGGSGSLLVQDLRREIPTDSPVIVCGSTAEGEDELLLAAFQEVLKKHPSAIMVLAPRHPERFDRVAGLVGSKGLALVRRSSWTKATPLSGCVFLLDSVGELAAVYALAGLAFVGGSLVEDVGGHNILEPAQYGVPVLTGAYTFNFREIVDIFQQGGGIVTVTPAILAGEWLRLLADPEQRRKLGEAARELFLKNSGATARTLQALQPLLRRTVPTP